MLSPFEIPFNIGLYGGCDIEKKINKKRLALKPLGEMARLIVVDISC
jgi:hypothetical protein